MGYERISCPSNGVNLNCMNKICSINPNDPTKAICICSKINNQNNDWVTFNKKNTKSSCNYLSGASNIDFKRMNDFIVEFNKQKHYSYIFSHSSAINFLFYKDTTYNITNEVVEGLNQAYKKQPQGK